MTESTEQRSRRSAASRYLDAVLATLPRVRETPVLIQGEAVTPTGIVYGSHRETWQTRINRLQRLEGDLRRLRLRLAEPIPAVWWTASVSSGTTVNISGGSQAWHDTMLFYVHFTHELRRNRDEAQINELYIQILQNLTPRQLDYALGTGLNIVVADPEHRPHDWTRLSGFANRPGTILEVFTDYSRRYFYTYRSRRVYLLRPP